jgi:hypothetical protein
VNAEDIAAAARELVERTCTEQNLPPAIEDAVVLRQVAADINRAKQRRASEARAAS